jgi:cation:H+ antiporter
VVLPTYLSLALAMLFLWKGADWIVDSAAAVARKLGISELVIGLTVVALGTSAPEFVVTATAAFKDYADISLSNVVGSNIMNIGLILGLVAMIRPVTASRGVLYRDGLILLLLTQAIIIMNADRVLTFFHGLILVFFLAAYIAFMLFGSRDRRVPVDAPEQREAAWWDWPRLAAGFVVVALGGNLMVESAKSIAFSFGVSEWLVGMTIVAGGTSLPELVTCLAAALKGKSDMLMGNLIGSNFFNFAGVLGLTCLMRTLTVSSSAVVSLWALLILTGLVLVAMRTGWRVSRVEGAVLLAYTAGYWIWDFWPAGQP